jgi:hypothetical protein
MAQGFSEVELNMGRTIPIQSTIAGLCSPSSEDADRSPPIPGDQEAETWTNRLNAVNEIIALPGLDLHRNAASSESGVLVSRLEAGCEVDYGKREPKSGE